MGKPLIPSRPSCPGDSAQALRKAGLESDRCDKEDKRIVRFNHGRGVDLHCRSGAGRWPQEQVYACSLPDTCVGIGAL